VAAFVLAWLEGAVSRDALEPSLGVTVERQVWTVVRLSGELDYGSRAYFDDRLFVLVRAAVQPYICVDLSGLEFCDSRGVACLVRAWRASRERGGALVLMRPGTRLARKLTVMGLNGMLPVVEELPGVIAGVVVCRPERNASAVREPGD
jgi:anti-sigma B factor antagonist